MRLTLRTLLAYMDEILEPGDREELTKKIESSEFANDLIHRTKDTMRRLRLSAPQVVGTGIGLDPNTVAEYLDNMLPPDSVADFERICLESDVHLAEVASAHHVLTMVLGEPAEVDPVARQRMYAIPAEAERLKQPAAAMAHAASTIGPEAAGTTPSPATALSAVSLTPTPSTTAAVPDYLRASAWSRQRVWLAACAAVLLVAVTLLLASGLAGWFGGEQQLAHGPTTALVSEPALPRDSLVEPPVTSESSEPLAIDESASAPALDGAPPPLPLPQMSGAPPAPPQDSSTSSPPAVAVDESDYSATPPEPTDRYADAQPTPSSPVEVGVPPALPATPPEIAPAAAIARDDSASGAEEADVDAVPPATGNLMTGIEAVEVPAETPAELGTYLDDQDVLLRFDPSTGAWFRMALRSKLQPGDRLLALPAFYPKLTLTSGLHLKLAGGTLVTFAPSTGSGEPAIDVAYGKLVIVNTSGDADDSGLQLTIGSETAHVRFGRNALLAIDAVPKYSAGQDPRESASPIVAQFYVRAGDVDWEDAAGSRTIPAPSHWSIEGGLATAGSPDATFPDWIDKEPVESQIDYRYGAPFVKETLDATRPVEEQLLELYQSSRRREVKSLVARGSVYVGQFVPFVEALRDSEQRPTWKMHIDTLRRAMALGPESAEKIYQTLVDQRGKEAADDLYQMLCGYGPEQIGTLEQFQSDLGVRLIDWMENDSLDYRVLAVQDMAEITGMRLMSNPAGLPAERARLVRLWRLRLKSGDVPLLAQ